MNEEPRDSNQTMPALFIGHGSPMNVVEANKFTKSLKELSRSLPKPKAIMVVSAHWLTEGTYVTCMDKPRTIHDFYGFPEELYEIKYPSPGAPSYAKSVIESAKTVKVECDTNWGLDHASWAVLTHMYPELTFPRLR